MMPLKILIAEPGRSTELQLDSTAELKKAPLLLGIATPIEATAISAKNSTNSDLFSALIAISPKPIIISFISIKSFVKLCRTLFHPFP